VAKEGAFIFGTRESPIVCATLLLGAAVTIAVGKSQVMRELRAPRRGGSKKSRSVGTPATRMHGGPSWLDIAACQKFGRWDEHQWRKTSSRELDATLQHGR
jgi:hypothetical protein